MSEERVWRVEIVFSEHGESTRADALVDIAGRHYHGWGRAKRSTLDPDRPRIGEEIAAARALENLIPQLLHAAETDIEQFEGHPVHVYR